MLNACESSNVSHYYDCTERSYHDISFHLYKKINRNGLQEFNEKLDLSESECQYTTGNSTGPENKM